MPAVLAGLLSERVTIQQATASSDAQGGRAESWSTLATVWASVVPASRLQDEALQTSAVTAVQRYHVEMRYRADVTPKMRVTWTPYQGSSAKTLEIQSVQPKDGRRELLILETMEVPS